MKKEWETPKIECLFVEDTAGPTLLGGWDEGTQSDTETGDVGKFLS